MADLVRSTKRWFNFVKVSIARRQVVVLYLDTIQVTLVRGLHGVSVRTKNSHFILEEQTTDAVSRILTRNFEVVRSFYALRLASGAREIDSGDLSNVSLSIVFRYLPNYNFQRRRAKFTNRDLHFLIKDFECTWTYEIIVDYFKGKYPAVWEEKTCALTGWSFEELRRYSASREFFRRVITS